MYDERHAGNTIKARKPTLGQGSGKALDATNLVLGRRVKIKLGDGNATNCFIGPDFVGVDHSTFTGEIQHLYSFLLSA